MNWERLEWPECLRTYSTSFITDRHDLVISTKPKGNTSDIPALVSREQPSPVIKDGHPAFQWAYQDYDTYDPDRIVEGGSWTIGGNTVSHCYSEKYEARCTLHYHIPIMVTIIAATFMKLAAMSLTLFKFKSSKSQKYPLVTIGDAIDSFLNKKDIYTEGMCTITAPMVTRSCPEAIPRQWDNSRPRFGAVVSTRVWLCFTLL